VTMCDTTCRSLWRSCTTASQSECRCLQCAAAENVGAVHLDTATSWALLH
jgi:hypothetical protein